MSGVRSLLLVWAVLLALLAMTVAASLVLSGAASAATSLSIAVAKAALIFWAFMHLREESGLVRLAAIGAAVWLLILFTLTAADYLTRGAAF